MEQADWFSYVNNNNVQHFTTHKFKVQIQWLRRHSVGTPKSELPKNEEVLLVLALDTVLLYRGAVWRKGCTLARYVRGRGRNRFRAPSASGRFCIQNIGLVFKSNESYSEYLGSSQCSHPWAWLHSAEVRREDPESLSPDRICPGFRQDEHFLDSKSIVVWLW